MKCRYYGKLSIASTMDRKLGCSYLVMISSWKVVFLLHQQLLYLLPHSFPMSLGSPITATYVISILFWEHEGNFIIKLYGDYDMSPTILWVIIYNLWRWAVWGVICWRRWASSRSMTRFGRSLLTWLGICHFFYVLLNG